MHKIVEIIIILVFLSLILVSLKVAIGASPNTDYNIDKVLKNAKSNLKVYEHELKPTAPNTTQTITMIKEDTDAFNYLEQACIKKDIKLKYCKTIIALIDEFNIKWNGEGKDPYTQ